MSTFTTNNSSNHAYKPIPLEIEDKQDEIIEREETYDDDYSDSDDDGHDNNNHDDDEQDSMSSTGSWKDVIVWSAWRQHAVAIVVAVLATAGAAVWQQQQRDDNDDYYVQNKNLSPVYSSTFRHEHLNGYHRTANISFCGQRLTSKVQEQLELMDFHLPLQAVDAFELHFLADAMEDDDYALVLGRSRDQLPPASAINNEEFHCLRQLKEYAEQQGNKQYVKGMTYFYQPPSYMEMYPQVAREFAAKYGSSSSSSSNSNDEQDEKGLVTGLAAKRNKKQAPKPASLTFTGFAAKFINLSPYPVLLYWDGKGGHADSAKLVGEIPPFDALGTATTPGQSFSVTPIYDSSHALERWVVTADDAVVVYEDVSKRTTKWTKADHELYQLQRANLEFAKHYLIASHRHWLGHFPRAFPVHAMRRADFVGQTQAVTIGGSSNDNKIKNIDPARTLQLKVVSVTPRVLSMDNFLSPEECLALIQMAQAQGMQGSTLYAGGMAQQQRDMSTRSSTNTWLSRDTNAITDRIYRRAAQVLDMKESLLQQPPFYLDDNDENASHHDYTQHSIAESLQVVRYQPGEEYTAHHDFVYPSIRHRYQPTRYATLLLYLNDDFTGGETNFPRAINPTNHEGITVKPEQGKAVLFYNMLPDGNVDDLSQHRSMPVKQGEKWLANLWVWDPVIN